MSATSTIRCGSRRSARPAARAQSAATAIRHDLRARRVGRMRKLRDQDDRRVRGSARRVGRAAAHGRHRTLRGVRGAQSSSACYWSSEAITSSNAPDGTRNTPVKGWVSSRIRKRALPTAKAPNPSATIVVELMREHAEAAKQDQRPQTVIITTRLAEAPELTCGTAKKGRRIRRVASYNGTSSRAIQALSSRRRAGLPRREYRFQLVEKV